MKQSAKRPDPQGQDPQGDGRIDQDAIGARLRQLFLDVVNEPVPPEFLELLRGADAPTPPRGAGVDDKA
jgi:hypothetical protein